MIEFNRALSNTRTINFITIAADENHDSGDVITIIVLLGPHRSGCLHKCASSICWVSDVVDNPNDSFGIKV